MKAGEILGWGNWIRTNTNGVRVRSSTVKLCPNAWLLYAYQSQFASTSLTLFTEIHSTTPTQQILHDFHIEHLVRNRLRSQQQHVAPVHVCRHRTLAKTELERLKVRPCPSSPPFHFYQVFLGFYSHIICF